MPPKAVYLAMENNPELEFEFFLAEKLGRTVTELRETLSAQEFLEWSIYYGRKAQKQQMELESARGK